MITSGYKGFGRSGIVFPSISPRVSALKKIAVSRKFELDLGHKGLIYHLIVQPSVFFRPASKTDGRAGQSVCRTSNGLVPCVFGVDPLCLTVFVFEAITTGQLVPTPDQVMAIDSNVNAVFFTSKTRNIRFRIAALIKSSVSSEVIFFLFIETRFRSDI